MTLLFQHSDGSFSLVAHDVPAENVLSAIRADVHARNPCFKIYYIRDSIFDDGTHIYDVGSHTEFYYYTNKAEAYI